MLVFGRKPIFLMDRGFRKLAIFVVPTPPLFNFFFFSFLYFEA